MPLSTTKLSAAHLRPLKFAVSSSCRSCLSTPFRRTMASTPLLRPVGANPPAFHQTIMHSDGSTFTLRSTSPRSLLKLTKDSRNHALWNPALNVLDDQTGELAKFEKAFGDFDLDSFAEFTPDASQAKKSKKIEKAPEPVQQAKKGGKKKK